MRGTHGVQNERPVGNRVQPDPQFPPRLGDDIAFNGDGMISRFHFHDGQCDFKQRWAQTDKWKLEHEAGHALFGAYRNPLTDDPSVKGQIRGTANTNAWLFGGKLWALKEDSPALVMDPATMETAGYEKFGGKMTGAPHYDEIAKTPNHGTTPVLFSVTAQPGSPGPVVTTLTLPKAAVQDLMMGIMRDL